MNFRSRTVRALSAVALFAVGWVGPTEQVSAHVVYGNSLFSDPSVTDPLTGSPGVGSAFSNQNRTVSGNGGWAAALNPTTWGDSHNVRFMYFNLAQPQTIDFTITATANSNGAGLLNPGYSIYSGAVPNLSHDGGYYPGQTTFADWSPFASHNPEIIANGGALTPDRWGEFRSNGDVTMASYSPSFTYSTMTYTGKSDSTETGTSISGHHILGPGLYTLVVGGANSQAAADLLAATQAMTPADWASNACSPHPCEPTNPTSTAQAYRAQRLARNFNIQFNVSPVPIPAAVWLFGSGIAGIAALARRRNSL